MKLKMSQIDNNKVIYNFFWDTTQLIEYDLRTTEFTQKEVLFECKIPRFSKVVVCPITSNPMANTSSNQVFDGTRVFCIGGYINEGN